MKTFTMSDEDAIILEKIMLDYVEYRPEYFGSLVKAVLGDEPLRPCPFCGRLETLCLEGGASDLLGNVRSMRRVRGPNQNSSCP
jgi:hypothetical protein